MSIEQVWGSSWAVGAWADGAWSLTEAVVPAPQPQTGGGGGSNPSRSRRRGPPRSRRSYGAWVRVDDEDTRRERQEREEQRKRAVAEEVRRSLARLAEIERERKRVHHVFDLGRAGSVSAASGGLSFAVTPAIMFASRSAVEVGSGVLAFVVRDQEQTRQYDSTTALVTEMAEMRKQMLRMKRNMEVLEVLMLAA